MSVDEIQKILVNDLLLEKVYVNKSDSNHYQIIAISDRFIDMSVVQRQKIVYKPLMDYISKGYIHSISIQTFTFLEWKSECDLIIK